MKSRGGFWWPEYDRDTFPVVLRDVKLIPEYLKHVKEHEVIVQAGGNVGVYPIVLSHYFKRVLTFEPDMKNYACLLANLGSNKYNNIQSFPFALTANHAITHTAIDRPSEIKNCGAIHLNSNKGGIRNPAYTTMLDIFQFPRLDFLWLDIEGAEMLALMGARETIERCKPVISLEIKGLGERFGFTDSQLKEWIKEKGYKQVDKIGRDVIFQHV